MTPGFSKYIRRQYEERAGGSNVAGGYGLCCISDLPNPFSVEINYV